MDNEILISTKIDVDYAAAEKELIAIQKRLDKLKEKQEVRIKLVDESLSERRYGVMKQLEAEREKLSGMTLWKNGQEGIDEQKEKVKELSKEFTRLDSAVSRYNEQIIKGDMEISQMEGKAKELATTLADRKPAQIQDEDSKAIKKKGDSAKQAGNEMKHAGRHAMTFGNRIKKLAKTALVFSVITMGLRAVRSWFMKVIQTNDATAKAFANLKGSLMTLIQPLMNTLIPLIEKAFSVLTRIVSFIATIFSTLFGTTLQASAAGAEALNDSVHGTADGLGSANDEAKKLKRTLAGFDEINILENPEDSSGGGGGGASATAAAFDFAGLDFSGFFDESELQAIKEIGEAVKGVFEDIWGIIKEIVGLIIEWGKEVDFTPVLQAIKRLIEAIGGVIRPLLNIVKTVWEKLLAPLLKRAVEDWLPRLIDSTSMIFEIIGKVFTALEPIISAILQIVEPIIEIVTEVGTLMTEMMNKGLATVLDIIAQILIKVAPFIQWIADLLQPIIEALMPIIELILELASALNDTLLFIIKLIIDVITGDMDAAREDFNGYIGDMSEHLNKFKELFEKLKEAVVRIWDAIKNAGVTAWEAIRGAWSAVTGFFSNVWNGIKTGVVNAMNSVIGAVESAINWIIDCLNTIIGGINKVIQGAGKIFGANWSGIGYIGYASLGRIPLLAQGAVIPPNNPFLATLGDNKSETEIVSPLSTMKEALAEANFNGDIKVFLDGKQISDSVTKYQLRANRALGV